MGELQQQCNVLFRVGDGRVFATLDAETLDLAIRLANPHGVAARLVAARQIAVADTISTWIYQSSSVDVCWRALVSIGAIDSAAAADMWFMIVTLIDSLRLRRSGWAMPSEYWPAKRLPTGQNVTTSWRGCVKADYFPD